MQVEQSKPYLWIVGCQRSGSTHIGHCIARHRDVGITIEGKLLYYCLPWILRDPGFDGSHIRFDEIAHSIQRRPVANLDRTQLRQLADIIGAGLRPSELGNCAPSEAIRLIHDKLYGCLFPHAKVYGDKYNEYTLCLDEVLTCFPDSRFVFIHRHPDYVAKSMLDAFHDRPWVPDTYSAALHKWAVWNQNWLKFKQRLSPKAFVEIAYDRFLLNSQDILTQVYEMMHLSVDDDAIAYAVSSTVRHDTRAFAAKSDVAFDSQVFATARELGYELTSSRSVRT